MRDPAAPASLRRQMELAAASGLHPTKQMGMLKQEAAESQATGDHHERRRAEIERRKASAKPGRSNTRLP